MVASRYPPVYHISQEIRVAFGASQGTLMEMAPDQDFETRTDQTDALPAANGPRPARRSGRGRRGRGRGRKQKPTTAEEPAKEVAETAPTGPAPEPALETTDAEDEASPFEEVQEQAAAAAAEPEVRPEPISRSTMDPPRPPAHSSSRPTVQGAIDDVNEIMASLRETLEQMEEVLEMLEHFERQGDADERELESLRRALRSLQRPRDGGHHHRGRS
jgi:hypothetical protein